MKTILDPRNETLPRTDVVQLQLERLQALLARLKRNVRRYREMLGDIRIESLDELGRLPFTTPDDLVAAFPFGMFALPLREVIRVHSTVGPDGKQMVIGHTRNDLAQWGRLAARQLTAAGVSAHDAIQVCFEGGTLPGASGYVLGAEQIEASVIAEDPFHVEYQLSMLLNYRANVMVTTPTNAFRLADLAASRRIDPQSLPLRTVILSRPVTPSEREALKTGLFADLRCNYGVPEISDPGLCLECSEGRLHVQEDHFLAEIVEGELVVTTLCREAMPLLRYRTRERCDLAREKCACGRSSAVLTPVGRADDRLRVSEKALYRAQISELLLQTPAGGHPFRVEIFADRVLVTLQITRALFSDRMRDLEILKVRIESEFLARLGIRCEVLFAEPRTWGGRVWESGPFL